MRGVGEHVHGLEAQDAVARLDGERQLAGERLWVAGDEDAAVGPEPSEDLPDDLGRASVARRVEDDGVECPRGEAWQRLLHRRAHQLQPTLGHAVLTPVELGVPGPLPTPLDGGDRVAAKGDGQGEEATAAVEVEDTEIAVPRQRLDHQPYEGRRRRDVRLEEGGRRHEEGRPQRIFPDVPRPRDPLRLAADEVRPRPVMQVEDEALRLLGSVEDGTQRRLERRVVARRHQHRDRLPLVAARANDHVPCEALRAHPGGGDPRAGERVPQGEGDAVGARGVDGALLDGNHIVRPPREVAHDQACRAAAEHERGLLAEAPWHAVAAWGHPDRRRDTRRSLPHRPAQPHLERSRLAPELLGIGDVLPGAAAARRGVTAAGHDAVGRSLLDRDDLGQGAFSTGATVGSAQRTQSPHPDPLPRDPAGYDEPLRTGVRHGRPRPVHPGQRDDDLAFHASAFRSICRA